MKFHLLIINRYKGRRAATGERMELQWSGYGWSFNGIGVEQVVKDGFVLEKEI